MKALLAAASLALGGLIAQSASAGTLSGKITGDDGKPIAGAMVTLTSDASGLSETVYSDAKGAYQITTALSGDLGLRVRKLYFADLDRPFSLPPTAAVKGDFTMNRLKTAEEISDQLPAAYHFATIPFEPGTPFARDKFQNDCLTCHQLGNSFTRWPRSMEDWVAISKRMAANIGDSNEANIKKRAELFAAAFTGKPISARPVFPYDPALAKAKVVMYRLDKAGGPHDPAVSADDGKVYMVDGKNEEMVVTDPKAGTTEYYPAPHEGMNPGGKFARVGMNLSKEYRGLHSLALGKDGLWYITESIASEIGTFDPKTNTFGKSYEIPGNTLYPHTIHVDKEGIVWFSIIATNQMGRLDPKTGEVKVIALPVTPTHYLSVTKGPYGMAIDPKDGSVWYAKIFGDRIGRVDPKTFQVTEWDSPAEGPRRMDFDASGDLWISAYSKGELIHIKPNGAKEFKSAEVIPMPTFSKDAHAAPYSLGVNPKTGDIWMNEGMTDHAYRYIPAEKRWVLYPMPLMGTFTRDTTFTKEGYVCASTNPSPLAALEGGVAQLICIHPEGDVKVEARAN